MAWLDERYGIFNAALVYTGCRTWFWVLSILTYTYGLDELGIP